MPVSENDICKLYVSKQDILICIERALNLGFEDNLRKRHINVKFDSKLRGYLGEVAFNNWLKRFGVFSTKSNQFNVKTKMDVDFKFLVNQKSYDAEVKTSLIPDEDKSIKNSLLKRDIKLIKRGNKSIDELESDLHIQIFYKQLAVAKDNWLKTKKLNFSTSNIEDLYYQSAAYRYLNDIFFVGWISKEKLIEYHTPSEKTWSFKNSQRIFWNCNISTQANSPLSFIKFLKGNAKT
jgi:hypothetical protein